MATGQFYGDSLFNFDARSTRRMVQSAKSTTNAVTVTIVTSPTAAGGVAVNPFKAGDKITVNNVASWADSNLLMTRFLVVATTSNTVTYSRIPTTGGKSTTCGLNAIIEKRTDDLIDLSPWGLAIPEERRLSTMFAWNSDLTATTKMCAMQVRFRDIITKFWSNPEVVRAYNKNYNAYKSSWTTYGPQGGYNLTKFVNATMCIIFGTSHWDKQCVDGLDGTCESYLISTQSQLDDKRLGLWQLLPSAISESADWAILPSDLVGGASDMPRTWLHAEWNTRGALWIMWRRLFWETSPTIIEDRSSGLVIIENEFTSEQKNPFRWLSKAEWNPATQRYVDNDVKTCWGSGCSTCPPYGSNICPN